MLTARPLLSLVVPIHNAAANAPELAHRLAQAVDDVSYELLFVDEGDEAMPSAMRRVLELAADGRVRLLHRRPGQPTNGLAAALDGIRAAKGEFIGVLDAGPLQAAELVPTLLTAAQDADLVVASRFLPGGGAATDGLVRRAAARVGRLPAVALFPRTRSCTDPFSGFFLFRREVIEGVELHPVGSSILLEILVRGRWARLTEIPWADDVGADTVGVRRGGVAWRHLRELRLHGPHRRGAVRYRRQRVAVGPDDPQPLDEDLPDDPEIAGRQRRCLLWTIGLMALALRFVLLPLGHNWDVMVDYNVFVDLAHNHSPYDTMGYLSHIARSATWDVNYEYYAYPPAPLYMYWPLAHLYAWLHPQATYFFPVPGTFALPRLSWDFYFLLKLPVWIADFLVAAVLARMAGTIRGWRDYLLNPFVLLVSGAWTFDAIMLLGLVLGVYFLQKGKMAWSGLALAFGTMMKFFPILVVPTCLLFLIKKQRPLREMVTFVAAFVIGCLALVGPFAGGLLNTLLFHDSRVGGGMNWEMIPRLGRLFPPNTRLDPPSLAIAAFGTPMLAILMLLGYWYAYTNTEMRLNRMILVTFLAFFIGSKLVNEQYVLLALPFAMLEAWQVGGAWRWFARLLWIVPLAYAVVRVPIDRFLWLFYHTMFGARANAITTTGVTGLESPFLPWENPVQDAVLIGVLGVGFFLLCVVAILWPVRPARAWHRYDPLRAWPLRRARTHPALLPSASTSDTTPQPPVLAGRT
jgi:hypothetical protein